MCASLNSENFDPSPREGIPKDKIKNEIQLCFSKLDRIELGSSLKQDGKWAILKKNFIDRNIKPFPPFR